MSQPKFMERCWRTFLRGVPGARRWAMAVLIFTAACAGGSRVNALTIIPTFADSFTNYPSTAATIKATIYSAIAEYEAALLDPIQIEIIFTLQNIGLGASGTFSFGTNYSGYRSALVSRATSPQDTTALLSIPNSTTNPVNGSALVGIHPSLALALGFATNTYAGLIYLNPSICNLDPETDTNAGAFSLFAVICHEIDEVLGGGGGGTALSGTNGTAATTFNIGPMDLFRYSFPGGVSVRSFNTAASTLSYFSLDGTTNTVLARFNQSNTASAPGDYADFATGTTPAIQDAFGTPGAQPTMGVEWIMLDVIGYRWNRHTNVWSNATASSGAGTVYSPAPFSSALTSVPSGGVVLMKGGSYAHPGRISTACKLKAVNGTARIH